MAKTKKKSLYKKNKKKTMKGGTKKTNCEMKEMKEIEETFLEKASKCNKPKMVILTKEIKFYNLVSDQVSINNVLNYNENVVCIGVDHQSLKGMFLNMHHLSY